MLISTILIIILILVGGNALLFTGQFVNRSDAVRRLLQILFIICVAFYILIRLGAIKDAIN